MPKKPSVTDATKVRLRRLRNRDDLTETEKENLSLLFWWLGMTPRGEMPRKTLRQISLSNEKSRTAVGRHLKLLREGVENAKDLAALRSVLSKRQGIAPTRQAHKAEAIADDLQSGKYGFFLVETGRASPGILMRIDRERYGQEGLKERGSRHTYRKAIHLVALRQKAREEEIDRKWADAEALIKKMASRIADVEPQPKDRQTGAESKEGLKGGHRARENAPIIYEAIPKSVIGKTKSSASSSEFRGLGRRAQNLELARALRKLLKEGDREDVVLFYDALWQVLGDLRQGLPSRLDKRFLMTLIEQTISLLEKEDKHPPS